LQDQGLQRAQTRWAHLQIAHRGIWAASLSPTRHF
jgi:hypothetical protein